MRATAYILLGFAWVIGFAFAALVITATPSPTAVNVAASEGPSGLTSSMSATQARTEALGAMVAAQGVLLGGTASWYCGDVCTRGYPDGMYAAAGRELQTGDWRGRTVKVCAVECIDVKLIDVCECPGARIIDLYRSAFDRIGDPRRGILAVTVEYGATPNLPPTDKETP